MSLSSMDAASAKDATKRLVEEQKYKRFLEESNAADLSDIERLGLISCQGTDYVGRRIVTFALGKHTMLLKKEEHRKKLLMYFIKKLDTIVQSPYVLVYCHGHVNLMTILLWLRKAYALLPRKFKKNLKEIFMLHPTKLLNVMSKVAKILGVSKKVFQKVRYPQTIAELQKLLQPMPKLPNFVYEEDRLRVQKLEQHAAASNAAAGLAAPVPKPRKPPLGQVFGRPLVGMPCFKQNGQMPGVLDKLADYLAQQRCSRTEGIFRVPAQADMLQSYTAIIDKGGLPDFLTNGNPPIDRNVHSAAGLYKFFWRKIPDPLIPVRSYRAMLATTTKADMDEVLKREIAAMPMEHHQCLLHLLDFLSLIAFEHTYNKMSKSNLAMVFAPSVLRDCDASPMQEMATIKGKVEILHYLLETYKSNNLFRKPKRSDGDAKDVSASAAVDVPPTIPPRNRPKALPTGSLMQLSEQLALLGDDGDAASTDSASAGVVDSTNSI